MERKDGGTPPVLGVDVGGTKILVGLVDAEGRVLESRRSPMDRGTPESTQAAIAGAVADFWARMDPAAKPAAMGFGLVGQCDPESGLWVRAANLPVPAPVPLARQMSERYGIPAFLDNDVFSAARAEAALGAGRRHKDFLLVNIGTGLSMGIVSGGRLVRGAAGAAGEVGQCRMGLIGTSWRDEPARTLEQCASGGGMIARALAERTPESSLWGLAEADLHSGSIFAAAAGGDALAGTIAGDAVEAICEAAVCLMDIFNPAAMVFAGSVGATPGLLEAVRERVAGHPFRRVVESLREVCLSGLDARVVGLLGAATVARQGLAGEL